LSPALSVVIPTHNRVSTLPRVLDALALQTLSFDRFEVIVVDDGSTDATAGFLAGYRPPYRFRSFAQANTGPAGARNRGVTAAEGERIVFIGDDTIPESGFLAAHEAAHRERPGRRISVLGYTGWPDETPVTPFLDHINEFGLQFGYALIRDPESVPFNFFYTSNVSLPRRALLDAGLFDTTFPHAAWEDIELAYRLSLAGFQIVFCRAAVTRHHHEITLRSFRRRQEKSGEAAAIFYRKHPALGDFLGVNAIGSREAVAPAAVRLWAALCQRWEVPGGRRALERVLRADYLRGLRRALGDEPGSGRHAPSGRQSGAPGKADTAV
jgi:GT2 family glycosyltransferase